STLTTRAPRSASWRVAKGAATACSSPTTGTPSSGPATGASLTGAPEEARGVRRSREPRSTRPGVRPVQDLPEVPAGAVPGLCLQPGSPLAGAGDQPSPQLLGRGRPARHSTRPTAH